MNLEELPKGKEAVIEDMPYNLNQRLSCLNIRKGKQVRKITQHPLKGPIIIQLDGRQCAIGRGMAKKIIVK